MAPVVVLLTEDKRTSSDIKKINGICKLMQLIQTTYKHYKTIVSKNEHNNVYAEIKAAITAQH